MTSGSQCELKVRRLGKEKPVWQQADASFGVAADYKVVEESAVPMQMYSANAVGSVVPAMHDCPHSKRIVRLHS